MGGGSVGDESEVDARVKTTGIEPLQFADCIVSEEALCEEVILQQQWFRDIPSSRLLPHRRRVVAIK
jgi:hypothetical protein